MTVFRLLLVDEATRRMKRSWPYWKSAALNRASLALVLCGTGGELPLCSQAKEILRFVLNDANSTETAQIVRQVQTRMPDHIDPNVEKALDSVLLALGLTDQAQAKLARLLVRASAAINDREVTLQDLYVLQYLEGVDNFIDAMIIIVLEDALDRQDTKSEEVLLEVKNRLGKLIKLAESATTFEAFERLIAQVDDVRTLSEEAPTPPLRRVAAILCDEAESHVRQQYKRWMNHLLGE